MPIPFLSADWVDSLGELLSAFAAPVDVEATVQFVVTNGDGDEIAAYVLVVAPQSPVAVRHGRVAEADVLITMPYEACLRIHTLESGIDEEFFLGNITLDGEPETTILLNNTVQTKEWESALSALDARSEYATQPAAV
jgi:hypothetical protein